MKIHLILGLGMGALALLLALSMGGGAIRRLRTRDQNAPTYRATGGPIYALFQIGCAGLVLVAGALIIGLAFRLTR
ncbi:MAG: hypothetical protein ACREN8_08300 [Candidatus Dormibacteraceae bacterium]